VHPNKTQEQEYGRVKQTFVPPYKPITVTDAELAFPAKVVGTLLPKWEEIPEEFRRMQGSWVSIVNTWFCRGIEDTFSVKKEHDANKVWRHLAACMHSFEPDHAHKIAGVAYLMSLWVEPPSAL